MTEPTLTSGQRTFVEQFALAWQTTTSNRMEARIIALLMIVDRPYLSSGEIATLLTASAGSVSTATRHLSEIGFIHRVAIAGDRSYYFAVEDDVWGGFLASERHYLRMLSAAISVGMDEIETGGLPERRLRNAHNYMTWLRGYHTKMLADWQAYRDASALDGQALPQEEHDAP
ncbi:GbsR/MarR family transcriptional regulator [Microbacterium sp.]|uniref:GbsR/MarR family transcriptional regulator n=1 Tax=Microbacterium sp. TaxID=51671 RepID=UPI002FE1E447